MHVVQNISYINLYTSISNIAFHFIKLLCTTFYITNSGQSLELYDEDFIAVYPFKCVQFDSSTNVRY